MKTLKIKDKLLVGIFGQVLLICLLVYFAFNLNFRLDTITQQRTEYATEVNDLKGITFLFTDYFNNKIEWKDLETKYLSFESNYSNSVFIVIRLRLPCDVKFNSTPFIFLNIWSNVLEILFASVLYFLV